MRRKSNPRRAPDAVHDRLLAELVAAVSGGSLRLEPAVAERMVRGIARNTAEVHAGTLFVAVPGTDVDGHTFIDEAVTRGACAVVAERAPARDPGVPLLLVPDSRRALAELAAAWHGHPADRLQLVGITGTIGKTSILSMLADMVERAARPLGSIGSLGIRVTDDFEPTGHTAPDSLVIHDALRRMVDGGLAHAVLEATSHALVQRRLEGLRFDVGVFTNLVPFEHVDYHRSFRAYVDAKSIFFHHLAPAAPLLYNADDRAVRGLVRGRDVRALGCGYSRVACVRIEPIAMDAAGTRFAMNVRRPLPGVAGSSIEPVRLRIETPLLGRANALNATLAGATALCLGAAPSDVETSLREAVPPRRRMQLLHLAGCTILDDTVGHPESLTAVFDVVGHLPARARHIVFGIRGSRGRRVNRRLGETLAIWLKRTPVRTLIITRSNDVADERNRVRPAERAAFLQPLEAAGISFDERSSCADAVATLRDRMATGDLVLLLGAQGMDRAADLLAAAV